MIELRDSRRLTGPNLLWNRAGAVLDVSVDPTLATSLIRAWETEVHQLLNRVGWVGEQVTHREHPHGVSLAISAPMDALYAATEVNEYALERAMARATGESTEPGDERVADLRKTILEEANPRLTALQESARHRGVALLADDDHVSVGLGSGAETWPVTEIPHPGAIDWRQIHDIPVALITGTNGKTTTVRVLASMAEAAGQTPGISSTDWIQVGNRILDRDDWSGPGGARRVLREPEVELALLETARGGMLRRGLAVESADVALITNVAEDHLGEWGVTDLQELTNTKFIVSRVTSTLVLNADDVNLVTRAAGEPHTMIWFSMNPANPVVTQHLEKGGRACISDGDTLFLCEGSDRKPVLAVSEAPMTFDGAAKHNLSNALAALGVAWSLSLPVESMRAGLRTFSCDPDTNPGRLNVFELQGVHVLVDYAHNPHGIAAILEMAAAMPAERRLAILGQAGDRDDDSIRSLARTVAGVSLDRIVLKELKKYLRGREAGEVSAILEDELLKLGVPSDSLGHAGTEWSAVQEALAWARPGDLLLLFCHEERSRVIELLTGLRERGWKAGDSLPQEDG